MEWFQTPEQVLSHLHPVTNQNWMLFEVFLHLLKLPVQHRVKTRSWTSSRVQACTWLYRGSDVGETPQRYSSSPSWWCLWQRACGTSHREDKGFKPTTVRQQCCTTILPKDRRVFIELKRFFHTILASGCEICRTTISFTLTSTLYLQVCNTFFSQ